MTLSNPLFHWLDFAGLFLMLAGIIIGLGAVTVIDIHGFLAKKSPYWTEAATRTHKVTKPLIWAGIFLAIAGGWIFYRNEPLAGIPLIHALIALALMGNGLFLSFKISPYLLKREKEGRQKELLPASLQRKIIANMLVSFVGWWSGVALLAAYLTS